MYWSKMNIEYSAAASGSWVGWALAHPEFGSSVNYNWQVMLTTLLLAHPDLKSQRHIWSTQQSSPMSKMQTSLLSTPWPFWTGILSQVIKNDDASLETDI